LTTIAVGFAFAAIVAGIGIGLARLVREALAKRRLRLRDTALHSLMDVIDGLEPPASLTAYFRKHPRNAVDLVLSVSEIISGTDRQRLIDFVRNTGFDDWLRGELRRSSRGRKIAAVRTLTLFSDTPTEDALRQALSDRHHSVRINAALALAVQDRLPIVPAVLRQLSGDSDERSLLLRKIFERVARIDAAAVLRIGTDVSFGGDLRALAIEAVGHTGGEDFAVEIEPLAGDPDKTVRTAALVAQAEIGNRGAFDQINAGLSDPEWEVRAAAIDTAARLALVDLVDAISARLEDEIWWVRLRAAQALIALGERGVRKLSELKASKEKTAAPLAALVLAEAGLA
jgi:HEAT repeat protein